MRIKICKDGYIWRIISKEAAIALFDIMEIYRLYDDDFEALINGINEIEEHSGDFGIEIGFLSDLTKKYENKSSAS